MFYALAKAKHNNKGRARRQTGLPPTLTPAACRSLGMIALRSAWLSNTHKEGDMSDPAKAA